MTMGGKKPESDPSEELLQEEQALAPEALSSGDDRISTKSSGDDRVARTSSGDDR